MQARERQSVREREFVTDSTRCTQIAGNSEILYQGSPRNLFHCMHTHTHTDRCDGGGGDSTVCRLWS